MPRSGVRHPVFKNHWLGAETGVPGLRGFSLLGSDWEGPNSDLGAEGYASLTINFRPLRLVRRERGDRSGYV
jgi:hypothetical protein